MNKNYEFPIQHKFIQIKWKSGSAEKAVKKFFEKKGNIVIRPYFYIRIINIFETTDPKEIKEIFEKGLKAYSEKNYKSKYWNDGYLILSKLIHSGGFDYRIKYAKEEMRPIMKNLSLLNNSLKSFLQERFKNLVKGIPDFLVIDKKTKKPLFVEVKDFGDSLSREQFFMIKELKEKGFETIVITPLFNKTKNQDISLRNDVVCKILTSLKNKEILCAGKTFSSAQDLRMQGRFKNKKIYKEFLDIDLYFLKSAIDFIKRENLCMESLKSNITVVSSKGKMFLKKCKKSKT